MAFNTTRLATQIKIKGALPEGRFSDQELLDMATDNLISVVAPLLVASREEYYLQVANQSVTANKAAYPVPSRALGMGLREVQVVCTNEVRDLPRIDLEDVFTTDTGEVESFYLLGNDVVLYPTPSATADTLKLTYFVRPSNLVPVTSCAVITAINTGTNTLTCTPPTSWTTADSFDVIQGRSGFVLRGQELIASNVNAGNIVFSATLPTTIEVGDYVALAGESCFPHLPAEAHQLLVHLTVATALEAMGDREGMAVAMATADKMKTSFQGLIAARIQGAARTFSTVLI